MSFYEEQLSALIEEIATAFRDVSREDGVSLSEAWVIDDYGSDEERAAARKKDTDIRWQDVPDEAIYYGYSCLSFLDEIGLRYYMPAYMTWALKNYVRTDSMTPESMIYALTLSDKRDYERLRDHKLQQGLGILEYEETQEWQLRRFCIYTPEQSQAVAHFLSFLVKHHKDEDAQKALDRFWRRFI